MSVMSMQSAGFERRFYWVWIAFSLSLFIHLLLAIFAARTFVLPPAQEEAAIPVEFITAPKGLLPVVDLPEPSAKDAPEDAKFSSDKNIKVDEETGGATQKSESLTTSRPQVKVQSKPKSFSFSQSDLLKEEDVETLSENQLGLPSQAFLERLRKGNELKVNAKLFDYGQYINRMREKLSQRWNGRSTITAAMFNQRVVEVSIAVVLDRNGEIIELRNMATSRFKRYDDEALRTLRESGPFPNPPESLFADDGNVYMTWNFTMTIDGWGAGKRVE